MKHKRLISIIVIPILVIIGLIVGLRIINSPSTGKVRPVTAKAAVDTVSQTSRHDGSYASYQYPSVFTSQPPAEIAAPILDRHVFTRGNMTGWQLSVTIYDLPDGKRSDNGDYNLRTSKPERFERMTQATEAGDVEVFADKTAPSFNKVAFLQRDTTLASVALSGAAGMQDETLNKVLAQVIDSWRFK